MVVVAAAAAAAAVKALVSMGEGVAAVYDSVGRETFLKGFECLRRRGHMLMFGESSGAPDPLDVTQLTVLGGGSKFLHPKGIIYYCDKCDHILTVTNAIIC